MGVLARRSAKTEDVTTTEPHTADVVSLGDIRLKTAAITGSFEDAVRARLKTPPPPKNLGRTKVKKKVAKKR